MARKYVILITETAMGTSINAQENEDQPYVRDVKTYVHHHLQITIICLWRLTNDMSYDVSLSLTLCSLTTLISTRVTSFLLRTNFFYRFSSMRREINRCLHTMHSFSDGLIRQRRRELLEQSQQPPAGAQQPDSDGEVKRLQNFVDILLHVQVDGRQLTDREIREEVDTFMFEGHDTTTAAITFALYNIAKFPDVQRKCMDEIYATIGDDCTRPLTGQMLNSLPYMDLVIKETLRMYPPVPSVGRRIQKEVTISTYKTAQSLTNRVLIASMRHRWSSISAGLERPGGHH